MLDSRMVMGKVEGARLKGGRIKTMGKDYLKEITSRRFNPKLVFYNL